MNIKQRMRAIKLSDKLKMNPDIAKELGVEVNFKKNNKNSAKICKF